MGSGVSGAWVGSGGVSGRGGAWADGFEGSVPNIVK